MMMMPFVRLLAIYALVGVAIFAFLKRDEIAKYFDTPNTEEAAFATPADTTTTLTEPVQDGPVVPAPAAQSAPEPAAQPTYSAPPVFGSDVTPQYFGQKAASARPTTPLAPSGQTMVARWTQAREVFSRGNITQAAGLYEALTTDFPDNIDLHGETGNLYYNLGQFGKAATHFLAVGKIAYSKGDMQMAGRMLGLLQRIAPTKATELQAIMNAGR